MVTTEPIYNPAYTNYSLLRPIQILNLTGGVIKKIKNSEYN